MGKKIVSLCGLVTLLLVEVQGEVGRNVEEKWNSPTPWIQDRLDAFLDRMPHGAVVVEIGVHRGEYAEMIVKKTKPSQLYLIDCWHYQDPLVYEDALNLSNEQHEECYQDTLRRFTSNPQVIVIKDFSKNAVAQFADESLDWVYIDANHGYEPVQEDLSLWWPKIKKGGILSGHDYAVRPSFGVVQAVNEFLLRHNLKFHTLTVGTDIYDSWAIQKPVESVVQ